VGPPLPFEHEKGILESTVDGAYSPLTTSPDLLVIGSSIYLGCELEAQSMAIPILQ
jgi:hypothetical protein